MQYISVYISKGKFDKYDLIQLIEMNGQVKIVEDTDPSFLMLMTKTLKSNVISDIIKIYAIDNYLDLFVWISNEPFLLKKGYDLLSKANLFETKIFDNQSLFLNLVNEGHIRELLFLKEILVENNLLETVKLYIENNMNMREASNKLFIHRNTLIQRLKKVESLIGLNVKEFIPSYIIYSIINYRK